MRVKYKYRNKYKMLSENSEVNRNSKVNGKGHDVRVDSNFTIISNGLNKTGILMDWGRLKKKNFLSR